jgi:hypothetical protein
VVFNFAVNESKALRFATELLDREHGRLLAPINSYDDYWMKQTYTVMDGSGRVLERLYFLQMKVLKSFFEPKRRVLIEMSIKAGNSDLT